MGGPDRIEAALLQLSDFPLFCVIQRDGPEDAIVMVKTPTLQFDALPIHAEAMPCVHHHSPDSGLYRRLIDQTRTAHIRSKVRAERPY